MAPSWNKEINWFISYTPWEQDALEQEIQDLKTELTAVQELADTVTDYQNLNNQIASLQNQRTSTQIQLNNAYSELNAVRTATQNINTALGIVGAIRLTCCGSMEPTLDENDLVFIQKAPFGEPKIGDVVIAANPECYGDVSLMHRIVATAGDQYITQGDNVGSIDRCSFTKEQLTWKMLTIAKDAYP